MARYEPIINAFFTRLQACGATFAYYSRRFLPWEAMVANRNAGVYPIGLPALFLYDGIGFGGGVMHVEPRGRGTPGVRVLKRTVIVYAEIPGGGTPGGPDATTAGGTVFAPLYEAIEDVAFANDSEGALTLGNLVSHCWIEGDGHWITGDIDPSGFGMMTVPVSIMLP